MMMMMRMMRMMCAYLCAFASFSRLGAISVWLADLHDLRQTPSSILHIHTQASESAETSTWLRPHEKRQITRMIHDRPLAACMRPQLGLHGATKEESRHRHMAHLPPSDATVRQQIDDLCSPHKRANGHTSAPGSTSPAHQHCAGVNDWVSPHPSIGVEGREEEVEDVSRGGLHPRGVSIHPRVALMSQGR